MRRKTSNIFRINLMLLVMAPIYPVNRSCRLFGQCDGFGWHVKHIGLSTNSTPMPYVFLLIMKPQTPTSIVLPLGANMSYVFNNTNNLLTNFSLNAGKLYKTLTNYFMSGSADRLGTHTKSSLKDIVNIVNDRRSECKWT